MVEFYSQRLGNAFVVGLGGCEIMKIWFKAKGESNSVFTEEQAEEFADGIVRWLRERYDESSFDEKEFGGSSEMNRMALKLYDQLCRYAKE